VSDDALAGFNIVFKPNPGPQTEFLAAPEREVLYGGPLADDTLVITDKGRRRIDMIGVGDKVLTPGGSFATVTEIPFVGEEDSYVITFSNGRKVVASEGHKWSVSTGDWAKTPVPFRTLITKDLLNFKLPDGNNRWRMPRVQPFNGTDTPFLISPYMMGVLLGDGCIRKCVQITSNDIEIIDGVAEHLHEEYDIVYRGKYQYHVVKHNRCKRTPNIYYDELRRLNLFGKNAFSKSIPGSYLMASEHQRLELLRGLMDTDGTVRNPTVKRTGAEAKYTTVSEKLRDDFIFLAESLGFRTTVYSEVIATGSIAYRIIINGNLHNPFKLRRKYDRYAQFKSSDRALMIVNIEYMGKRNVRCITIDSEQHLFVLDGNIVTHNSAGGGKSYAMLADPMRYFTHPQFSGLLLRHTTEELRELIWKSQELYPKIYPGIKWSERKMQWEHPSGARLWMSYLDRDEDVLRYQGLSFSFVGWDELGQWKTPFAYDYMRSRLRTTGTNLPLYIRASSNPGGPGGWWVKKMYVDPSPPGRSFWATDIETGETLVYPPGHTREGQPLFKRRFIPARLKDNPHLYESGDYEANLLSLPEHQRKQLLDGNWDLAEGAAFPEFNRAVHVVEPYTIPNTWTKFRACDYGYGSWTCVLWFAVAPDESIVVYRELYVTKVLAEDLANMVLSLEQGEAIQYGMLDSSCWHKRGDTGPSIAERMILRGCRWRPSDRSAGSRVAGKNEVHRRLQIDKFTGKPRITIFNNCKQLVADLPSIPLDKKNPEDVDTSISNDHCYDTLRYGLMSRPRAKSIFDYDPTKPERHSPACLVMGY